MSTRKYRPYFTLAELKHLHSLCHSSNQVSPLTGYLGKYISDIESGYRIANHTLAPSVEQKLGFSPPSADSCTTYEREQERRYLAGEMNEREEIDYLSSIGVPTK